MMAYSLLGIENRMPDAEVRRSSFAKSVRVVRQRRITGNRSKRCNVLILRRFGTFTRTREVPKTRLRQGNSRTARNRLDFVMAANRLYGACIRGARAPASLKLEAEHRQDAVIDQHPGRARPGLIEALTTAAFATGDAIASGARAPRPH